MSVLLVIVSYFVNLIDPSRANENEKNFDEKNFD